MLVDADISFVLPHPQKDHAGISSCKYNFKLEIAYVNRKFCLTIFTVEDLLW